MKDTLSDLLVGGCIGLVIALVVMVCTGCTPAYTYSGGDPVVAPTVVTRPATAIECPTGGTVVVINGSSSPASVICNGAVGSQGPNGNAGHDGSNGATGPTGPQGNPGIDPTPITFVQLCQGITPSYPNTFPEIAMCINSNLYGVYSANNGFLVYMPPGGYSSNGINASCNFTVLPKCVIQ